MSSARSLLKDCAEDLSWLARDRREFVRSTWVESWDSRRKVVLGVGEVGLDGEGCWFLEGLKREVLGARGVGPREWAVVVDMEFEGCWAGRRGRRVDVVSDGEDVVGFDIARDDSEAICRVCACGCADSAGEAGTAATAALGEEGSLSSLLIRARMSSSSDESEGKVPSSCWPSS